MCRGQRLWHPKNAAWATSRHAWASRRFVGGWMGIPTRTDHRQKYRRATNIMSPCLLTPWTFGAHDLVALTREPAKERERDQEGSARAPTFDEDTRVHTLRRAPRDDWLARRGATALSQHIDAWALSRRLLRAIIVRVDTPPTTLREFRRLASMGRARRHCFRYVYDSNDGVPMSARSNL